MKTVNEEKNGLNNGCIRNGEADRRLRSEIVSAGVKLYETGLVARTWGNISARTDADHFLITPSGREYLDLPEEDIVEVRMDDLSWSGSITPSSEKLVHRAIYRARPEAAVIIHTHQIYASAVGCGEPGGGITVAAYGRSGSQQLCDNVEAAVRATDGNYVIMKNHGAVFYGGSFEEVFAYAFKLEQHCRKLLEEAGIPTELNEIPGGSTSFIDGDPAVRICADTGRPMFPYLDDFAMIVGTCAPAAADREEADRIAGEHPAVMIRGEGALCTGNRAEDAEAAAMIMSKNAMAELAARAWSGAAPLSEEDAAYMRKKYTDDYSRLAAAGRQQDAASGTEKQEDE